MAQETYELEEVIAVDAPTPKRRRLTDYFTKLPSNTEAQEFPQCLRRYIPTDRRAAPPKCPVGRPKKNCPTDPQTLEGKTSGVFSSALPTEGHVLRPIHITNLT